jgi:centromere protein I
MAEEPRERDEGRAHLGDLERGQYHVPQRVVVRLKPLRPYLLMVLLVASKIPAKQRIIKISSLVDKVCLQANDKGLPNASLNKLVDIITLPNELDQASLATLIRNLYPASKVPDAIVIKVVGSLGHGHAKPSHAVQAALLRWLVLVYDVLENQRLLSQLYSTLFNLLDTIAIRYAFAQPTSLVMHLTSRYSANNPP